MLSDLSTDTLQSEIDQHDKVLVQFSAGWCGNCRIMKPKFKKMSTENSNIKFLMIDAEKNPISRKLANVDNLPTFAYFKNGNLENQVQTNKADILLKFVNEAANN
jgi:thiol-disulfide isomerase/thioredoxin